MRLLFIHVSLRECGSGCGSGHGSNQKINIKRQQSSDVIFVRRPLEKQTYTQTSMLMCIAPFPRPTPAPVFENLRYNNLSQGTPEDTYSYNVSIHIRSVHFLSSWKQILTTMVKLNGEFCVLYSTSRVVNYIVSNVTKLQQTMP